MFHLFLPSATKLRRLCFYTCLSFSSHGGGCYPSMHCRWYPSMPCSRSLGGLVPGVPAPGGSVLGEVCSGGGCACSGGVPAPEGGVETPPESRLLLLRTVHILLECILVILLLARSEAANSFI